MKVNIPEKYAELYLKALIEKKGHLLDKIREFEKEIKEIDQHIQTLTSIPIFHEETYQGPVKWETTSYKEEWSWSKKVEFYFSQLEKVANAKDIVEFIINNEKNSDRTKVRSSISAALSNGHKNRSFLKFTDPVSSITYYGKPDWFNEKSIPKMEHIPEALKEKILK
ncbi:MAG: hypothetical protein AAF363_18550 [Bacteroidota bacterium]